MFFLLLWINGQETYLSCEGHPVIETPTIDRLAKVAFALQELTQNVQFAFRSEEL